MEVWIDRGLTVDLQPIVLKQLKQDVNGQNQMNPPAYLVQFIGGVGTAGDHGRALALLDAVATIYLGPADKRNDFIKKNYQANMIQPGTPNGRIYSFRQLMDQLFQRSDLAFLVLEHLEQYDEPPTENLQYRVSGAMSEIAKRGAESTLKSLAASPWLQNVDHFHALVVAGGRESMPLVSLLQQISNPASVKEEFVKLLEAKQTERPTFGGGLILAYFEQSKTSAAIPEYVASHLTEIQALPENRQIELAALLRAMMRSDALGGSDASESVKAVKEWTMNRGADRSQSVLARVEKAKGLAELGIQNGQVQEFVRQKLPDLMQTDTAAAVKVFLRISELVRQDQRRGNSGFYIGGGETIEGAILNQSAYNFPRDWQSYAFVADLINNDQKVSIETSYPVKNVCENALAGCFERLTKANGGKEPPISDQLHSLYADFGQSLDGRSASLVMPTIYERISGQLNPESCATTLAWLKEEAAGGQYPELAADLTVLVELIAAEKAVGKPSESPLSVKPERPEMADYHQRFRTLINDEKLSLTWRICLASFLAGRQGEKRLPLELAQDWVALYNQALAADAPITNDQNAALARVVLSFKDDPAAAELVTAWREKWAARYLKPAKSRGPANLPPELRSELNDPAALSAALELYLAAHEVANADQLTQKYSQSLSSSPQVFASLVRAEQPAMVADLIRRNWSKMQLNWPADRGSNYDSSFAALAAPVFEQLKGDDERYFAELFFASMPDPEQKKEAAEEQPGSSDAASAAGSHGAAHGAGGEVRRH